MSTNSDADTHRTPFWDLRMLRSRVPDRALDLRPLQTRAVSTDADRVRITYFSSTLEPGEPWWVDRRRRVFLFLRRVETGRVPPNPYHSPRIDKSERSALARFAILLASDVLEDTDGTSAGVRLRRRLARLGRTAATSPDLAVLRFIASDLARGKLARRTGMTGALELRLFAEAGIEWLPTTLAQARLVPSDPSFQPTAMETFVAELLRRGFAGIDVEPQISFEILRFVKSDGSASAAMGFLRRHALEVQTRTAMDDARRRLLLGAFLGLLHLSARRGEAAPLSHLDARHLEDVARSPLSEGMTRALATELARFPGRAGADSSEGQLWAVLDEASSAVPMSGPVTLEAPTAEQAAVDATSTTIGVEAARWVTINRQRASYLRGGQVRQLTVRHAAVPALVRCCEGRRVRLADRPLRDLRSALEMAGAPGEVRQREGYLRLSGDFYPTRDLISAVSGRRPGARP